MELRRIFNPESVALIGATDKPGSVGLGIAQNLLVGKKQRKIFFVNPYRKQVLGEKTYPKLASIKQEIDLVIVAIPYKIVLEIVKQISEKGAGGVIIISAGFAETGRKGFLLQEQVRNVLHKAGIPLIGPNCLGIIVPNIKLNASFSPAMPSIGNIAFISQSGALIDSVIDMTGLENYGFSTIISYGNAADIEISDFLLWLKHDKQTKVIALYVEGIKNGTRFMNIARDVSRVKPIIVLKAGKYEAGVRAISSHTGMLTTSQKIYSSVFKQTGLIEVDTIQELFDSAKALSWRKKCKDGLGIITNGGGCGVLAADYSEEMGMKLPKLYQDTIRKLEMSGIIPLSCSKKNPLDIVGDALSERYELAINAMIEQKNIHSLVVIQTLQIMTEVKKNAKIIIRTQKKWPNKPIIACFMGGKLSKIGIDLLEKNKIPNYSDPKRAILAIKALIK